jgi:hypothetical protein
MSQLADVAVPDDEEANLGDETDENTRPKSRSWSMSSIKAERDSKNKGAASTTGVSFYDVPDVKANLLTFALCLGIEGLGALATDIGAKAAFSEAMNALPSLPDKLHAIGKCDQAGNDLHDENSGECTALLGAFFNTLPDRIAVLQMFALAALILYAGYRTRSWRRTVNLGGNYLFLHACCLFMRVLTINSTTLPAPSPLCRNSTANTLPTSGWFLTPIVCNDSLFSGHTSVYSLIFVFVMCSYVHPLFKAFWCVFFMASAFCSAVTADHYTIDIIVAIYVAVPLGLSRRNYIRDNMGPNAVVGFGFEESLGKKAAELLRRFDY